MNSPSGSAVPNSHDGEFIANLSNSFTAGSALWPDRPARGPSRRVPAQAGLGPAQAGPEVESSLSDLGAAHSLCGLDLLKAVGGCIHISELNWAFIPWEPAVTVTERNS
jgi:hypothetical protein